MSAGMFRRAQTECVLLSSSTMRHVYIDADANWCNTLDLFKKIRAERSVANLRILSDTDNLGVLGGVYGCSKCGKSSSNIAVATNRIE